LQFQQISGMIAADANLETPMTSPGSRIPQVVAALTKVRDYLANQDHDYDFETESFNRWIRMLASDFPDAEHMLLEEHDTVDAPEALMHVEATLAFLNGGREGTVLPFKQPGGK
jgi:hypothetical protein